MSFQEFINTIQPLLLEPIPVQLKRQFKLNCDNINPKNKNFNSIVERFLEDDNLRTKRKWDTQSKQFYIWFLMKYYQTQNIDNISPTEQQWQYFSTLLNIDDHMLKSRWITLINPKQKNTNWTDAEDELIKKEMKQVSQCILKILKGKIKQTYLDLDFCKTLRDQSLLICTNPQISERKMDELFKPRFNKVLYASLTLLFRGQWLLKEDLILLKYVVQQGKKWSQIATLLPGRTENQVKNRYKSLFHRICKDEFDDELAQIEHYIRKNQPFAESDKIGLIGKRGRQKKFKRNFGRKSENDLSKKKEKIKQKEIQEEEEEISDYKQEEQEEQELEQFQDDQQEVPIIEKKIKVNPQLKKGFKEYKIRTRSKRKSNKLEIEEEKEKVQFNQIKVESINQKKEMKQDKLQQQQQQQDQQIQPPFYQFLQFDQEHRNMTPLTPFQLFKNQFGMNFLPSYEGSALDLMHRQTMEMQRNIQQAQSPFMIDQRQQQQYHHPDQLYYFRFYCYNSFDPFFQMKPYYDQQEIYSSLIKNFSQQSPFQFQTPLLPSPYQLQNQFPSFQQIDISPIKKQIPVEQIIKPPISSQIQQNNQQKLDFLNVDNPIKKWNQKRVNLPKEFNNENPDQQNQK